MALFRFLIFPFILLCLLTPVFGVAQTTTEVYVRDLLTEAGLATVLEDGMDAFVQTAVTDIEAQNVQDIDARDALVFDLFAAHDSALSAEDAAAEFVFDADVPDSCFEHYTFGSVQVIMDSILAQGVSGVPVSISGLVQNNNPYPVVNGSVYIKVLRYPQGGDVSAQGPDVIDEFYAVHNMSVPEQGTKEFDFAWKVPSRLPSGTYTLAAFFMVDQKFNLLGLPFTEDVLGNTTDVVIAGEFDSAPQFSRDSVVVADESYTFASFTPYVGKNDEVTLTADILNPTSNAEQITVTWQVYYWDGQRSDQLLYTTTPESVHVPAEGVNTVSHTVTDNEYPVYFVRAVAEQGDLKSILNMRFARDDIDRLRINFPGVTHFPFRKDQSVTVFSCLHNTAPSFVEDARLEIALTDIGGNEIYSFEHNGAIGGSMHGVSDVFVSDAEYTYVKLTAVLYQENSVVDQTVVEYFCNRIGSDSCKQQEDSSVVGQEGALVKYGVVFVVLLLVLYGALRLARVSKKNTGTQG